MDFRCSRGSPCWVWPGPSWTAAFGRHKDVRRGLVYDCAAFSYAGAGLALYLLVLPDKLYAAAWHRLLCYASFFAAAFLLAFNLAAEYYFFYEFGVRYNFIAVDYLVYTNEVLGNIRESYNLPVVLPLVTVLAAGALWSFRRRLASSFAASLPFRSRLYSALPVLAAPALCFSVGRAAGPGLEERIRQRSGDERALRLRLGFSITSCPTKNLRFGGSRGSFRRCAPPWGPAWSLTGQGLDINRKIKARGPFKKLNVVG